MKKIIIDGYEIELKDVDKLKEKYKIRAFLKQNPEFSKILISLFIIKPASVSELTQYINENFNNFIDRTTVYRKLIVLQNKGLVSSINSAEAFVSNKNSEEIEKIKEKHTKFLHSLPQQFRTKFKNVLYFTVTDYGKEFLEWCGNVIGLKVKKVD